MNSMSVDFVVEFKGFFGDSVKALYKADDEVRQKEKEKGKGKKKGNEKEKEKGEKRED